MWVIIQSILFTISLGVSLFLILFGILKKKPLEGLFFSVLPIILYFIVNFITEAVLFGTELYRNRATLPLDVFQTMNLNLSICDMKIVFSFLALLIWFWIWKKYKVKW